MIGQPAPTTVPNANAVRSWLGEAVCGATLAIIGAGFAAGGRRMSLFEDGVPGPGLVPAMIGTALVCLGVAIAVLAIKRRNLKPVRLLDRDSMMAAALMLAAVAVFESAGYLVTAFLFLFASFTLIGREPPLIAGIVSAVATFSSWSLFVKALGVPLPQGFLTWL